MTLTSPTRSLLAERRRRTVRDVVRGLLALAAMLAVVAGLPWLLLVITPVRLRVPTWDEAVAVLMRPDDGTVLLTALSLTAWACWVFLTVTILLELAAQLRGLPAVRLPGFGGVQHAVSVMVAAVVVMLAPAASTADVTHAAVADLTASAPAVPGAATSGQDHAAASVTAEPVRPRATLRARPSSTVDASVPQVTVGPGDTLWGLAERHLGDGERYDEIARLNYGRPQSDGRSLTDDHWLQPGWVLVVPAGATDLPGATATYTVRRGDTLSGIADRQLDDPDRYPEVFELNLGLPQPDGSRLTNPDRIRPGWVLHLPGPASATTPPEPAPAAASAPSPPGPEPSPAPATLTTTPTEGPSRAPEPTPSPAPTGTDVQASTEDNQDDYNPIGALLSGLGGLAAAGIIREVGRRRRRAQARRRTGERLPTISAAAEHTDRALRAHQQPVTLDLLQRSLQQLTASCREHGQPLPRIGAVLLSPDSIELRLTEPHPDITDQLPPFSRVDTLRWRLDPVLLPDDSDEDDDTADPCPALVTIGTTGDALVMLNLEAAGTLTITGDPERRLDVVRALAVELVTSPLTENAEITLDPALADLARVIDLVRAQTRVGPDPGVQEAAVRHHDTTTAWASSNVHDILEARVRGLVPDTWAPRIDIVATPGETLSSSAQPWTGHVLVTTAAAAESDGGTRWTLALADGDARLEPLGLDIAAQFLDAHHYRAVLELLGPVDVKPVLPTKPATPRAAAAPVVKEEVPIADLPASNGTRPAVTEQPSPFDTRSSVALEALPIYESLLAAPPAPPGAAAPAEAPRTPPTPEQPNAPHEAGTTPNGAPRLLLLGPIEIIGVDDPAAPSRHRRLTELVTFLALHPGATAHALDEALWPGGRVGAKTRNSQVSRARAWLGKTLDGEPYLMNVGDTGAYRLNPDVSTDWHDFLTLAGRGLAAGPDGVDDLTTALHLVRGRPFTGIDPRDYTWAEPDIQEMISTIADVAIALADLHHAAGKHLGAQDAAARGLLASPGDETLWHACLRAARARGDIAETTRLMTRFKAACAAQ